MRPRQKDKIDWTAPTRSLAKSLLGHKILNTKTGRAGYIVEVEAYLGLQDPAAHSYHGRKTPRVRSMYLESGHAYIYLIYGLHLCINVVAGPKERPEAVLIRALETEVSDKSASGPGRVGKFLQLSRQMDSANLRDSQSPLLLFADKHTAALRKKFPIKISERIGIAQDEAAKKKLRYYFAGHKAVSGPARLKH